MDDIAPHVSLPLGGVQGPKLSIIKDLARGLWLKHIRVTWTWLLTGLRASRARQEFTMRQWLGACVRNPFN